MHRCCTAAIESRRRPLRQHASPLINHMPHTNIASLTVFQPNTSGGRGCLWEDFMFRKVYRVLAAVAIVAAATGFLASGADARIGGGLCSGSRGERTISPPPSTSAKPPPAPLERTVRQRNFA